MRKAAPTYVVPMVMLASKSSCSGPGPDLSSATPIQELHCPWPCPRSDLDLSGADVHVWLAALDRAEHEVHSQAWVLSADERQRAARLRFGRDRARFIVARGALRHILAIYSAVAPPLLEFRYGPRGKPAVRNLSKGDPLSFNLSHSQGVALIAVTRGRDIGVDVERIRPVSAVGEIADRVFSRREAAKLHALPASQKQAAFFACWTRKEAYVKAVGEGLAHPLDRFDVALDPAAPARLLAVDGDARQASRWSLLDLRPAPGYVAAVAVNGRCGSLFCWRWPGDAGVA